MGLTFEEFEVGQAYLSPRRTVTEADIQQFAGLSGDYNPLHTDEVFAKSETPFGRRIAHGALTFAISSGLSFQSGMTNGTAIAFAGAELKFSAPVFAGDTIHLVTTCMEKHESKKPDRGLIVFDIRTVNQDGAEVMQQISKIIVMRTEQSRCLEI